ncbi:MAG TPA: glycosyltransferase family 87 protein [Chloroflexia bacterium]
MIQRPTTRQPLSEDPVDLERRRLELEYRSEHGGVDDTMRPVGGVSIVGKIAAGLAILVALGYLALWIGSVRNSGGPEGYVRSTDFAAPLTAAYMVRYGDGPNLYDLSSQRTAQNELLRGARSDTGQFRPYTRLPFEALALAPFMQVPLPLVFAMWALGAGLAIGLSLGMMDGALSVSRAVGWALSLAACSFLPLIRGLMEGQDTPFVLMGLCGTYVALRRGQPNWAGAMLILVALRPSLLPLVLLLIVLQRQWQALTTFVILFASLSALTVPVLGFAWPLRYVSLLLNPAPEGSIPLQAGDVMYNWRGIASLLFGADVPAIVPVIVFFLGAGLLVLAWLRYGQGAEANVEESRSAAETTPHRLNSDVLWATAGLLLVFTAPHLGSHDLTLLIFPGWIIGIYALSNRFGRRASMAWRVTLAAGYALFPVVLVLQGVDSDASLLVLGSAALMLAAMLWLTLVLPSRVEHTHTSPGG